MLSHLCQMPTEGLLKLATRPMKSGTQGHILATARNNAIRRNAAVARLSSSAKVSSTASAQTRRTFANVEANTPRQSPKYSERATLPSYDTANLAIKVYWWYITISGKDLTRQAGRPNVHWQIFRRLFQRQW